MVESSPQRQLAKYRSTAWVGCEMTPDMDRSEGLLRETCVLGYNHDGYSGS